jgi:Flp pilus assembly pilin Flp
MAAFNRDRSELGATAVEYGMIVALLSIAVISGAILAGDGVDSLFVAVGSMTESAADGIDISVAN